MARQGVAAIVLAAAMVGLLGGSANADAVETKFATLVRSGETITVNDDYVLVSKYFTLGVIIYSLFFTVLSIYLSILLYKYKTLGMRLVASIGLTAIGLPPTLTIAIGQFGFFKLGGGLDIPSACLGGLSIICITAINIINYLFPPHSLGSRATELLQPAANDVRESDPLQVPNKSQAMAEMIVEEGMPPAEIVVRYLIAKIETIAGENAYPGLPDRLRNGMCNIILNEHPVYTIVQNLHAAAPPASPLPANGGSTLVKNCRRSAWNKIDSFIVRIDHFRTELSRYRDRATLK